VNKPSAGPAGSPVGSPASSPADALSPEEDTQTNPPTFSSTPAGTYIESSPSTHILCVNRYVTRLFHFFHILVLGTRHSDISMDTPL